jgi:hypothetical protein
MTEPEVALEPLHVVLDKPGGEKDVAADWGSWQTFPLTATTPPQQILAQNDKRKQAQILVQPAVAGLATASNSATVNAPLAAGQLVTSVVLQPGVYTVNWTVQLAGTTSAADASNMQLMLNGVPIVGSINASTVGNVYAQTAVQVTVTAANSVLSINAIALPTATANYRASISAAQIAATGAVRVGTRGQVANNQGGLLQTGRYPVENKQELWLGSDGINAMTVIVLDERYE